MRKDLPRTILWLPTGGQIGDATMILGVFEELIAHNADLRVEYLVRRNASLLTELAQGVKGVHVVRLPRNKISAIAQLFPFIWKQQLVVVPPHPDTHPIFIKIFAFIFLCFGKKVVGFRDKGFWHPYKAIGTYDTSARYSDNVRKFFSTLGYATDDPGTPPHLSLAPGILPKEFPFAPQEYVVVHAFPTRQTRTLNPDQWQEFLRSFSATYSSLGIVLTGGMENKEIVEKYSSSTPNIYCMIDRPLVEVIGVLRNARIYTGVDTGMTHIAGMLRKKSVVITPQNDPPWFPDYNPRAVLVYDAEHCQCKEGKGTCVEQTQHGRYYRCVSGVTTSQLLKAVDGMMRDV